MTNQKSNNWTPESFFTGLFFIGAIAAYFFADAQTAILLALLALIIKPSGVTVVTNNYAPPPRQDVDPRHEMVSRPMGK